MKNLNLLTSLFVLLGYAHSFAGTPLTIGQNTTSDKLSNVKATLTGKAELHLTNATTPLVGSSVNLTTTDTWVYFDNLRPDQVVAQLKDSIFVNGEVMQAGVNCRIAVYRHGTAILPHDNTFKPLEVFTEPAYAGTSQSYALQVYNTALGTFNNAIQSFKLKKGYMATLANNADGTGYSRCFIADKEDLLVTQLPGDLNKKVSFIRVFPWEWVTKKGWGGTAADADRIKGTWRWDWSASGNSETGLEYVPIKEQKYWPSWATISAKNTATHLMGYCEPDNGENRSTVDETIAEWPNMLKTGLRVGTPSAINMPWIYEFIDKCDAKRYRVDYVTIHCYWAAKPASQWYKDLKAVYVRTKRPLWITEWNTGGNWTKEPWPSDSLQALQKQLTDIKGILQVLDTASFVERYSIYNWVENKRAMIINNVLTPAGEYYAANKSVQAFNPLREVIPISKPIALTTSLTINTAGTQLGINWSDPNGELTQGYSVEKKGSDGLYKTVLELTGTNLKYYREDFTPMANAVSNTYRVNIIGGNNEVVPSAEMSVIATTGNSTLQYGNAPVGNTEWNTFFLQKPFGVAPVVILGSLAYNNATPLTNSLRVTGTNAVTFHLDPWVYLGAVALLKPETQPYMMMPSGEQTLGAIDLKSGSSAVKAVTWTYIPFAKAFATVPVVFPTLKSTNNTIPVTVRVKDVTTAGFYAILRQEQGQTGTLLPEIINYVAVTQGTGTLDGKKVKVGMTPAASVGGISENYKLTFGDSFTKPVFFCAMQSYNDTITSTLRYTTLTSAGVTIFKQREVSKSSTAVAKEAVGWMVIEEADAPSSIEKTQENKLTVFPNPAKDKIYISGLTKPVVAEVVNLFGQLQLKTITENTLDISSLSPGFYILRLDNKQTFNILKK